MQIQRKCSVNHRKTRNIHQHSYYASVMLNRSLVKCRFPKILKNKEICSTAFINALAALLDLQIVLFSALPSYVFLTARP